MPHDAQGPPHGEPIMSSLKDPALPCSWLSWLGSDLNLKLNLSFQRLLRLLSLCSWDQAGSVVVMQNKIKLCVSKHTYHVSTAKLLINIKESVVSFYMHCFSFSPFHEAGGMWEKSLSTRSRSKPVVLIQVTTCLPAAHPCTEPHQNWRNACSSGSKLSKLETELVLCRLKSSHQMQLASCGYQNGVAFKQTS